MEWRNKRRIWNKSRLNWLLYQFNRLFLIHYFIWHLQNIFRRDEIWFVERNSQGEGTVYSLDRFKERYDKVLSKAYLEGKYGAIPTFMEFSEEG